MEKLANNLALMLGLLLVVGGGDMWLQAAAYPADVPANPLQYKRFVRHRPMPRHPELEIYEVREIYVVRRPTPPPKKIQRLSDLEMEQRIRCDFEPNLPHCKELSAKTTVDWRSDSPTPRATTATTTSTTTRATTTMRPPPSTTTTTTTTTTTSTTARPTPAPTAASTTTTTDLPLLPDLPEPTEATPETTEAAETAEATTTPSDEPDTELLDEIEASDGDLDVDYKADPSAENEDYYNANGSIGQLDVNQ